jgi:hypothetical protein
MEKKGVEPIRQKFSKSRPGFLPGNRQILFISYEIPTYYILSRSHGPPWEYIPDIIGKIRVSTEDRGNQKSKLISINTLEYKQTRGEKT